MPALVRVQEQDPVPGQALVPGPALRAQALAAPASALGRGQVLALGVLALGVRTDRTALVPVTERDMAVMVRQTAQAMALVRVQEQDPVPGQALVPGPALRAQALAAPASALGRGQVLALGVLARGVHRDRTALVPVTERDMAVMVRQTAQAMALVTARARAGLGRAAAQNSVCRLQKRER
jgi:hypothetical protein